MVFLLQSYRIILTSTVVGLLFGMSACQVDGFHQWPMIDYDFEPEKLGDFSSSEIIYRIFNLERSPGRKAEMLQQWGLTGMPSDELFFKAVDGKKIDIGEFKERFDWKWSDRTPPLPGELGIFWTTANFMEEAKERADAISVIFEDDVVIPKDIDLQFRLAISAVPKDWDVLYLGCYLNQHSTRGDSFMLSPFSPRARERKDTITGCPAKDTTRIPFTPWLKITNSCTPGGYAYAVRSKAAARIFDDFKEFKMASDNQIKSLFGELNAYCMDPPLIRTLSRDSTIRAAP